MQQRMEETVKGKCDYITAINGLMFFIIIVGHCVFISSDYISGIWSSISVLMCIVFMMFMPWFFYKSGSFSEHDGTIKTRHYLKKYIRPFAIYGAIGMAVQFLVTCFGYGIPFKQWLFTLFGWVCVPNTVFGNDALWFLLTLFLVRSASDFILPKVHPLIVAVLSFGFAYLHFRFATPMTPWILGNFFSGLSFYALGYYMKKHENKNWIVALSTVVYVGYFFLVAFTPLKLSFFYFHHNTIEILGNGNISYPITFLFCFSGIIALKAAFRWLSKHYSFPFLSYIGRNVMNFYVTHWMVMVVAQLAFVKCFGANESKQLQSLFLFFTCALTLPLISKFINSIKAKKKCTIPIR